MTLADRLLRWVPRILTALVCTVPLLAAAQQGIPMVNVKATSGEPSTA